jgi:hypothetical protein
LPEFQNSVTIPGRGAAIVTYDSDGVTNVEVVDGRGVQFTGETE